MKKCPFCAEDIQDDAIKCRYCRSMLSAPGLSPQPPAVTAPPPSPPPLAAVPPEPPPSIPSPQTAPLSSDPDSDTPFSPPVAAESSQRTRNVVDGLILLAVIAGIGWFLYYVVRHNAPARVVTAATPLGPTQNPPATAIQAQPVQPENADPAQIRWVTIPAGSFMMGCTQGDSDCYFDENPPHRVTLTKDFQMAATETTNAQYRACVEAGACSPPSDRTAFDDASKRDHPVTSVPWDDAVAFCEWAGGRLPTEAEWEYAARGGKEGNRYPWGNELTHEEANYGKNECCGGASHGRDQWEYTSPVGSFPTNGFGLFDMAGNVFEWCGDWYDEGYYGRSPSQDPEGPSSGVGRVVRGGSWWQIPQFLRVSNRVRDKPTGRNVGLGFRPARGEAGRKDAEKPAPVSGKKTFGGSDLGYGWGGPPSASMQYRNDGYGEQFYAHSSGAAAFAGLPVEITLYGYYGGRLATVAMTIMSRDHEGTIRTLSSVWGEPTTINAGAYEWFWEGGADDPWDKVASYRYKPGEEGGVVEIVARAVHDRRRSP